MKKMTLAQMKKANKAIGHDYFSKDTMNFWNSKIEVQPNQYNLFIESSQPEDNTESTIFIPRRYIVKYFNSENSKVVSVTHFDSLELIGTLEQAMKVMNAVTKAFSDLANRENYVLDNLSRVENGADWMTFIAYDNGENKSFNVSYFGTICG